MKKPHFLLVDTHLQKLKVNQNFFDWAWSKMCVVNLVSGLYLKIEQMESTDFLHAGTKS